MRTASPVHPHIGSHHISQLYADLHVASEVVAHHANFDVSVLRGQNPFWSISPRQINCTMARAQSLALPGGLEEVCTTIGVPGKDKAGKALVMATCKPQRDGTFNEDVNTYKDLLRYAVQDVRALMDVDRILPPLSPTERLVFERTWRKNDLGLPIDIELATAIALRRDEIEAETTAKVKELTFDPATKSSVVTKLSQRQRIIDWCNSGNRAAGLESTQKHLIAEKLADEDLHPDVRELLELLKDAGGSAPMKAQALLNRHVGGWYKDATRYFGARSGRGTSEGANMFNIAKPSDKYDTEAVIAQLKAGFKHDNTALTDALRGCIVAPQGWLVCDNDLSNAEYRIAMWMAGDTDRLTLLAQPDSDPYMYNAIQMGWTPRDATKLTHRKERNEAKPVTLGGNYQLGWKTYMAHQRRTGRNVDELKARADIEGYRKANPKLVQLWYDLSDAFKFAIYEPSGRIFPAGKIAFQKDGNGTVWMLLPSGRSVPHYSAHITHGGEMAFFRGKFGAMLRQKAFGGSLLEIACQSMTRDIVTAAEADIENELPDCHLILDVYDSILALAPEAIAAQRSEQMRAIMRRPRFWTAGLPLDCEGYEAKRMKK